MRGLSKWKAAIYLAAIFIAGGVSGWVAATKQARQKAFTAPGSDEIAASLRTCMYDRLKLSEEQKHQIDAVIERSSKEVQSIHRDRIDRIRVAVSNRNSQIMGILRPEQQEEFEKIEKERRESWRQKEAARKGHGSGSRDGRKGSKEKEKEKEKEKDKSANGVWGTANSVPATNTIAAPVFESAPGPNP